MKILIGADGSEYSKAAIDFCREFNIDPARTSVRIVTAVDYVMPVPTDPMGVSAEYFLRLETSERAEAQKVVDDAVRQLRDLLPGVSIDVRGEVVDGSASRVLVEIADEWGADIIVLGSKGHGLWERVLLGSVSDSVVHHAHCSVLIVRKQTKSQKDRG